MRLLQFLLTVGYVVPTDRALAGALVSGSRHRVNRRITQSAAQTS